MGVFFLQEFRLVKCFHPSSKALFFFFTQIYENNFTVRCHKCWCAHKRTSALWHTSNTRTCLWFVICDLPVKHQPTVSCKYLEIATLPDPLGACCESSLITFKWSEGPSQTLFFSFSSLLASPHLMCVWMSDTHKHTLSRRTSLHRLCSNTSVQCILQRVHTFTHVH